MKRFLLGFVFMAGLCLNVDAANPSFSSFATNHFITNNFLIRSRLNPLQFDTNASTVTITNAGGGGTTNYFNTIYVTNLYATNLFIYTNVFSTNLYVTNINAGDIYATNIYVTNFYGGDTYTTNLYVTNITAEYITVTTNITIGGTNVATLGDLLWTNVGGILQPVTHSSGTNQFTIAEASGWTGTGTNAFFDDGTFNGVATINATDGYIPYRVGAYTLDDSPFYVVGTNAAIDSQFIFGPGTTNVLYRSGSRLIYDNSGASEFSVENTPANFIKLQLFSGLIPHIDASSTIFIDDNVSAKTLYPQLDNTFDLGDNSSSGSWKDSYFKGTHYVQGMNDGTGNYSRLAISHSGTNGAIVLDSQSSGTAGAPRDLLFKTNNILVASMEGLGVLPFSPLGAMVREECILTNVYLSNLPTGTNDVYTIPSGYKASIATITMATTNSGGTAKLFVKTNSTYYPLNPSGSGYLNSSSTQLNTPSGGYLFEENEAVAISTSNTGLNAVLTLMMYPSRYPLRSAKLFSLSTGTNTIVTIPAGYNAVTLSWNGVLASANTVNAVYVNSSGGIRTYSFYVVPSGGSVGNGTLFGTSTATDATLKSMVAPMLQAGDSLVINTDDGAATQMVWVNYMLVPK